MLDQSAARREILTLGQALQGAWNRGDAADFAALFTDDADFVAWNGRHGHGRQAIEDAHRLLFAGPLAGSQMALASPLAGDPVAGQRVADPESGEPATLRFVRPDVAVMVTTGAVTLASERAAVPGHESVQTLVMLKAGRRWRVTAFQNTRAEARP